MSRLAESEYSTRLWIAFRAALIASVPLIIAGILGEIFLMPTNGALTQTSSYSTVISSTVISEVVGGVLYAFFASVVYVALYWILLSKSPIIKTVIFSVAILIISNVVSLIISYPSPLFASQLSSFLVLSDISSVGTYVLFGLLFGYFYSRSPNHISPLT